MLWAVKLGLRVLIGSFVAYAGVDHFRNPQDYLAITPTDLPFPVFLVLFSGALEVLGGVGLFLPGGLHKLAAVSLIGLIAAMTTANVHMWRHNLAFKGTQLGATGHTVRLLIQCLLLAILYWLSTSDHEGIARVGSPVAGGSSAPRVVAAGKTALD